MQTVKRRRRPATQFGMPAGNIIFFLLLPLAPEWHVQLKVLSWCHFSHANLWQSSPRARSERNWVISIGWWFFLKWLIYAVLRLPQLDTNTSELADLETWLPIIPGASHRFRLQKVTTTLWTLLTRLSSLSRKQKKSPHVDARSLRLMAVCDTRNPSIQRRGAFVCFEAIIRQQNKAEAVSGANGKTLPCPPSSNGFDVHFLWRWDRTWQIFKVLQAWTNSATG